MTDWEPYLIRFLQRIGQPYDFSKHHLYLGGMTLPGDDDHEYHVSVDIDSVRLKFTQKVSPTAYLKQYEDDKYIYRAVEKAIDLFTMESDNWSNPQPHDYEWNSDIYYDWQEKFETWLKKNPSSL